MTAVPVGATGIGLTVAVPQPCKLGQLATVTVAQ